MFYTYVLKRKVNKWYIGYTDNIDRRLKEHSRKYTCELIYFEAYPSEQIAREREYKLKQYGSAWHSLKKRLGA